MPDPVNPLGYRSTLSLIGANLIAIILALYEGWDLHELMIIYWCQSVIIGGFSVRRMLDLQSFSTEGLSMNGRSVPESNAGKKKIAGFFALHYGAFHLAYLVFLIVQAKGFPPNLFFITLCIAAFFLNHAYSYVENRERDAAREPNIGTVMFFPYLRVVPMHLTIIAGGALAGSSTAVLMLFLVLKMAADVVMHRIEHAGWRK